MKGLFITAIIITFALAPIIAMAQEEPAEAMAVYGQVKTIDKAAGTITIFYYDFDNDVEAEAVFALDPDIKLENIEDIDALNVDDWVTVEYTQSEAGKVAKTISVDISMPAEEEEAIE